MNTQQKYYFKSINVLSIYFLSVHTLNYVAKYQTKYKPNKL